jgi:hypothetical protein
MDRPRPPRRANGPRLLRERARPPLPATGCASATRASWLAPSSQAPRVSCKMRMWRRRRRRSVGCCDPCPRSLTAVVTCRAKSSSVAWASPASSSRPGQTTSDAFYRPRRTPFRLTCSRAHPTDVAPPAPRSASSSAVTGGHSIDGGRLTLTPSHENPSLSRPVAGISSWGFGLDVVPRSMSALGKVSALHAGVFGTAQCDKWVSDLTSGAGLLL